MSTDGTTPAPSLVDTLGEYIDGLPEQDRPDALHQVFYGFYSRVAIIDRTIHDVAAWGRNEMPALVDVPEAQADALRDNALFVAQELFASRVRAMAAMGYVAKRLSGLLGGGPPERPFALTRVVAFDGEAGEMRTYDLAAPGEHPDLPYDVLTYDPQAA